MNLVRKLLNENISKGQLLGYALASLLGLTIVLLGVQFFMDIRSVFSSNESFFKKDFLVVSKRVSVLKTLGQSSTSFKEGEIEELKKQPFVSKLGYFTPSTFQVELSMNAGGMGNFMTDLFFESVPDEFLDVESASWKWAEGDDMVPIIIPRAYLYLYNFGFAQSQGLPQLSETTIEKVVMNLRIFGQGQVAGFNAQIAGFSNKLNTILVPQSFMEWANERYGITTTPGISRVLIEVNNPADPAIAEYIAAKGYEFNDDKLDAGKASYFLRLVTIIVLAVGVIITLLAIGLLMLSMNLLIHKNRSKLENLMLIGYSPKTIAAPYQRLALLINILVFILSLVIVFAMRKFYMGELAALLGESEAAVASPQYLLVSITLIAAICLLTYFWISYKINAVFKPE